MQPEMDVHAMGHQLQHIARCASRALSDNSGSWGSRSARMRATKSARHSCDHCCRSRPGTSSWVAATSSWMRRRAAGTRLNLTGTSQSGNRGLLAAQWHDACVAPTTDCAHLEPVEQQSQLGHQSPQRAVSYIGDRGFAEAATPEAVRGCPHGSSSRAAPPRGSARVESVARSPGGPAAG